MKLSEYFENTQGLSVLATADSSGNVDLAIYSRPHFIDEQTVAFIMREHLTYQNLKSNPNAAYMFVEKGPGYKGKRLYLTKICEEDDPEIIETHRRRHCHKDSKNSDSKTYLVTFKINRIRPLVGDE